MPYRVDVALSSPDAEDILINLGAIDIEAGAKGIAAILPDEVAHDAVTQALNHSRLTFSPALARDDNSVWLLNPRPIRIGDRTITLSDSNAFGTGHHPTTALCIEAIQEILSSGPIESMLDVGIGSGILAMTALLLGVSTAVGVDTDEDALKAAAENARLNGLADRLQLVHGGAEAVNGVWPLVAANILAAPLMEIAPVLVRRVGNRGRLILSGIPVSVESEVVRIYQRLGMYSLESKSRGGWTMAILQASW